MAKFYTIDKYEGVKIKIVPVGWRNCGIWFLRPFRKIPYASQTTIPFKISIWYGKGVSTDYRHITIMRGMENTVTRTHFVLEISPKDNKDNKFNLIVKDDAEHDDDILEYQMYFSRTGDWERVVYSKPIPSNWMFIYIFGIVSAVIVGFILFSLGLI